MEGPPTPHNSHGCDDESVETEFTCGDSSHTIDGNSATFPIPPSSSVHPHETIRSAEQHPSDPDLIDYPELENLSRYQQLRHRESRGLRQLTYKLLVNCKSLKKKFVGTDDYQPLFTDNVLRRFICCGDGATVSYSPSTAKHYISANLCRNRWCPACSQQLTSLITGNLKQNIGRRFIRMMTLTIANHGCSLVQQLDRMKVCSARMFKSAEFKAKVTGYACFFQVKYVSKTSQYHVHAHILCEGEFWDQAELSNHWYSITGDSYICDIRANDGDRNIHYAARYCARPADIIEIPAAERCMVISALHGRRLCQLGGTWKGWKLRATEKLPEDRIPLGSFSEIYFLAQQGHQDKLDLLRVITKNPNFQVETFDHGEDPFF